MLSSFSVPSVQRWCEMSTLCFMCMFSEDRIVFPFRVTVAKVSRPWNTRFVVIWLSPEASDNLGVGKVVR